MYGLATWSLTLMCSGECEICFAKSFLNVSENRRVVGCCHLAWFELLPCDRNRRQLGAIASVRADNVVDARDDGASARESGDAEIKILMLRFTRGENRNRRIDDTPRAGQRVAEAEWVFYRESVH